MNAAQTSIRNILDPQSLLGQPYLDIRDDPLIWQEHRPHGATGKNIGFLNPDFHRFCRCEGSGSEECRSLLFRNAERVRVMVISALIFLSVISWADAFQQWLTLRFFPRSPVGNREEEKDEKTYELEKAELLFQFHKRLVFATVMTVLAFILVWWLNY